MFVQWFVAELECDGGIWIGGANVRVCSENLIVDRCPSACELLFPVAYMILIRNTVFIVVCVDVEKLLQQ